MKKGRIKLRIAAVLLSIAMMPMNATAAIHTPNGNSETLTLSPRWSEAGWIMADIGADGTTIYVNVSVEGQEGSEKISGTIYLEKNVNGKWKSVKTWRISGKGTVDAAKTYKGVTGTEYRVRVTAKVGTESITETSGTYEI